MAPFGTGRMFGVLARDGQILDRVAPQRRKQLFPGGRSRHPRRAFNSISQVDTALTSGLFRDQGSML